MRKRFRIALLVVLVVIVGSFALLSHHILPKTTVIKPTYLVSLGDSVAAGDGLPADANATSTDTACNRSSEAYPNVLATDLKLNVLQVACSGATTTTGILQSQTVSGQSVPSQLTATEPYLKHNDVVITVGADDVGWSNLLIQCATSNCSSSSGLASYQANVGKLQTNLTQILSRIKSYHPHRVVVNTYYSLLPNTATCFAPFGITSQKIEWVNAREAQLNAAINNAALTTGVRTVHLTFSGHTLCDQNPWIQGLTGVAPLHPNAAGQQQIAQLDLKAFQ